MWVGSIRSPMRTSANEELATLAENNPLTGYEPNFINNYQISETTETLGPQTCMTWRSMTTPAAERSLHHCFRSEKIQRAVDNFYHSPDESLLSSQSSSVCHVRTGRPVFDEVGSLISNGRENPCRNSESEQIRILLER